MGTFRLLLAHPRNPDTPHLIAEHLDPGWLKQRGYEIARSFGDAAAIWTARPADGGKPDLALHCRTGHALAIVNA
ncbi:MAG TPA: hypothetical protein PKM60_09640 [Zoogloea sp.]|uniref:hypothetical protein n=1 Tax=Zoogloea sp. TaxID=49181 RepID=UPI002C096D97|nr:hypothetical protein [Zoogloea sp.]HOB46421.1 hypothetical protein [Zoogloea sp.]HQA11319.1 hypothetical protein [Zoogloea sp.]HQE39440.1 hypothetical protein [Zoogloea sp.]